MIKIDEDGLVKPLMAIYKDSGFFSEIPATERIHALQLPCGTEWDRTNGIRWTSVPRENRDFIIRMLTQIKEEDEAREKENSTFVTINAVQLAAELAEAEVKRVYLDLFRGKRSPWRTAENGDLVYIADAQTLFNYLNDVYTEAIEKTIVPRA